MLLLKRTTLQAPTMTSQTDTVEQKTSVTTARPKAMALHGVPALVITSDTPTIITNPLEMMTDIAIHPIVIALIVVAALVINMIAGNLIASQLLMTARAIDTMPNIEANPIKNTIAIKVPFS